MRIGCNPFYFLACRQAHFYFTNHKTHENKNPVISIINMKTVLMMLLCGVAILASGCAAGISRTGYQLPAGQTSKDLPRRPIAIQCNAKYDTNDVIVLGSIHAYDTGFSTDCDEAKILDIFCREASMVGADLINIAEESSRTLDKHLLSGQGDIPAVQRPGKSQRPCFRCQICFEFNYRTLRSDRQTKHGSHCRRGGRADCWGQSCRRGGD